MSTNVRGTFDINGWEESPYDEQDETKLTRTHVTKTFSGEIEGTSTAELLMVYGAVQGSAAYAGFERITASVNGRSGSFVLHHTATSDASHGPPTATWSVVPDSGTGELKGLRGKADISRDSDGGHAFTLDYDFE